MLRTLCLYIFVRVFSTVNHKWNEFVHAKDRCVICFLLFSYLISLIFCNIIVFVVVGVVGVVVVVGGVVVVGVVVVVVGVVGFGVVVVAVVVVKDEKATEGYSKSMTTEKSLTTEAVAVTFQVAVCWLIARHLACECKAFTQKKS